MKTQISRIVLVSVLLGSAWFCSRPAAMAAVPTRGGFDLGTLDGVFTVTDLKTVNGVSTAAGWLTANVTDNTGTNQVGVFTNFPVRMPVSGLMSGGPVTLAVDDPVILPELSTNTCSLLGVVVGAIDVTVPGLGLNVHLNRISLVVRSDRNTTIGNLLCNVLGDGLLGRGTTNSVPLPASSLSLGQANSAANPLTVDQARGLLGILLGPGVPGSTASSATSSSTTQVVIDPQSQVQNLVQRLVTTMQPSKAISTPAKPLAQ